MKLTPKQEKFCQEVASGKSLADAYRAAYNSSRMKPETIRRKAFDVMNNGNVTARVEKLKQELSEKQLWTREMSVKALIRVYADKDAPATAKVSAVKELNNMHGYYEPTRHELSGANGDPVELGVSLKINVDFE